MSDVITLVSERRNSAPVSRHVGEGGGDIDAGNGLCVVKVFSGDWYVSVRPDEMLVTILGSCVSACVRDPVAKVGGMNHFLLPGNEQQSTPHNEATRYGVFAMETLLNEIFKAGGRKERLEIKVFGGGNVINNSIRIGSRNAEFIRNFLKKEGYRIASEDLEGDVPRRIHYFPDTGKVMLRKLHRKEGVMVVQEEAKFTRTIASRPVEGDIDLF